MSEILTLDEVAKWLKCHPQTIYRMLSKHEIPAFRIGTTWRFVKLDLDLWLEKITVMCRNPRSR